MKSLIDYILVKRQSTECQGNGLICQESIKSLVPASHKHQATKVRQDFWLSMSKFKPGFKDIYSLNSSFSELIVNKCHKSDIKHGIGVHFKSCVILLKQ